MRAWQKGQAAINPGGWNQGAVRQAQKIFAEAGPHAAERQVALIDSEDDRVSLMATEYVLNRAIGKPKDVPDARPRIDLSALSQDQRRPLPTLLEAVLGAGPTLAAATPPKAPPD